MSRDEIYNINSIAKQSIFNAEQTMSNDGQACVIKSFLNQDTWICIIPRWTQLIPHFHSALHLQEVKVKITWARKTNLVVLLLNGNLRTRETRLVYQARQLDANASINYGIFLFAVYTSAVLFCTASSARDAIKRENRSVFHACRCLCSLCARTSVGTILAM